MVLPRHETEGLRGRIGREKLEMQLHLPTPTAAHQRTAPLSNGAETLTPAPPTPPALPAARAPPAQLFLAPARRTQPPRSVI